MKGIVTFWFSSLSEGPLKFYLSCSKLFEAFSQKPLFFFSKFICFPNISEEKRSNPIFLWKLSSHWYWSEMSENISENDIFLKTCLLDISDFWMKKKSYEYSQILFVNFC